MPVNVLRCQSQAKMSEDGHRRRYLSADVKPRDGRRYLAGDDSSHVSAHTIAAQSR